MKKIGKKAILLFLSILLVSSIVACKDLYKDDLEEYKTRGNAYSSVSITNYNYLLPNRIFLDDYDYIDGKFYYYADAGFLSNNYEVSLIYLHYEEDIYNEAKQYALDNMDLSNDNIYSYNNYEFIENSALPKGYEEFENGKNKDFPYHFIMFCYNDNQRMLIFMGFYCSLEKRKDANISLTDWEAFLKKYYSEYYNFDN